MHRVSSVSLAPPASADLRAAPPVDAEPVPAQREREQLHALTALRFVAAAMIVLLHTRGAFGFPADWGGAFQFAQAVPFFFMLSGFILTYVYPALDEAGTRRFLVARFARIWPAHAATFLLTLVPFWLHVYPLLPGDTVPAAFANLAMVHAWVPYADSYFSFNSPSWSISTEFGFYLLFPLLIQNWRRTWPVTLVLAFVLMRSMQALADLLNPPPYQLLQPGLDRAGLTTFNPLGMLYLFVLGMVTCLAWQAGPRRLRLGSTVGTVLEVAALAFTAWTLAVPLALSTLIVPWLSPAIVFWLPPVPTTTVAFAILIMVMALGQGLVSRGLSLPFFVLLGEVSYALYLIHVPVKIGFFSLVPKLGGLPAPAIWALYWLSALAAAWVLWWCVERPARAFLRGCWRRCERAGLSDGRWRAAGAALAAAIILILAVHIMTLR
jgi:peptidoglycan/LPS O-acetylase OafA/YrhL